MKKIIPVLLALLLPTSIVFGKSMPSGISGNLHIQSANDLNYATGNGKAPDPATTADPFTVSSAYGDDHTSLASANDSYLLVAANEDAANDLPFMDDEDESLEVSDPLEPFNRGVFWFNDKVYFYFMKPIARGYRFVMPDMAEVSVGKFFSNLETPVRMINAGLQGKFTAAASEFGRFGLNSTIGLLGFFDPADRYFGLKKKDEDTGQTLGRYGIGPGPYLVLPFLGPSSFRDALGQAADSQMNILSYLLEHQDYYGAVFLRTVNALSLDKDTYEGIKKDALDPYLFVRDAWTQYRRNQVEN